MRRMIEGALVALLGAIGASVTVVPAHAEDGAYGRRACVAYDGTLGKIRKETCAEVRWRNQTDGDGVVLEFLDVDTIDGAGGLSGYTDVRARWMVPGGGVLNTWDWGSEPDNFTKNHGSVRGTDSGLMDYRLRMCGGNDHLWWWFRLGRDNTSTLIDKGHEEDGTCGSGGGGN